MRFRDLTKAFTLVELLVVVAIIGLLMGIIIPSVGDARSKSRDARRIADLRAIEIALKTYYIDKQQYPPNLTTLVSDGYISSIPQDPTPSTRRYVYMPVRQGSTNVCSGFRMGAVMETAHPELVNDADASSGSLCPSAQCGTNCTAAIFNGLSAGSGSPTICNNTAGTAAPSGTERCYDIIGR